MEIPKNKEVFESDIAHYWFEGEILISLSKNTLRTVENISSNVALIKKITNNVPVKLLIFLTNSPVPDKATRKFSTEQLPNIYSAMAMVSKPGLAKFIMNILFKLKKPPIPIKSFSNADEGMRWLKSL